MNEHTEHGQPSRVLSCVTLRLEPQFHVSWDGYWRWDWPHPIDGWQPEMCGPFVCPEHETRCIDWRTPETAIVDLSTSTDVAIRSLQALQRVIGRTPVGWVPNVPLTDLDPLFDRAAALAAASEVDHIARNDDREDAA